MDQSHKMAQDIQICKQKLAIFEAGEKTAIEWRNKVDRAMFGYNGGKGLVDDVRLLKTIFKIILWLILTIFTPILGILGIAGYKILINMDKFLELIESAK